jgi:hypothetical protein
LNDDGDIFFIKKEIKKMTDALDKETMGIQYTEVYKLKNKQLIEDVVKFLDDLTETKLKRATEDAFSSNGQSPADLKIKIKDILDLRDCISTAR